jgi:RNA polymerase sigma-70 factor (ECF subfamily)
MGPFLMADTSEDYANLLALARRGNEEALARLCRLYEAELRIVARVQLGPALRPYLDSIDLVQSVHRSLLLGLRENKFDIATPQQLLALALTMVRRKVARHWRRMQRQQRLSGVNTAKTEAPTLLTELSAPGNDPAENTAFQDAIQQLWQHLNTTERRLIELRLQGYSTAEAARSLNLDPDSLRVRLSRLRVRLRATGVLTEWL